MNCLQTLIIIAFAFFINNNNNFVVVNASGLIEVYQWSQIDFYNRGVSHINVDDNYNDPDRVIFPDRKWRIRREILTSRHHPVDIQDRLGATNSVSSDNSYIAYNNVPMGVTHFRGRLFVTVPRRRIGIPSTLNYIDLHKERARKSPKLNAYPNFQTNELKPETAADPNRLVSVYRTTADECSRLWFIDTGILEYPNNFTQVKRPAIWVMDLNTDSVLRRFEIPDSIVSTGQGLASITIDATSNSCGTAYAYIPDLLNNQLYVYSYKQNRIWAFRHNYFNFDPLGGDLSVGGQTFRWNDGVFSTTLGPKNSRGFRDLYFHAMASTNEFVVSTEVLQNEANAARSDHGEDFRLLGSRGSKRQSTMHEFDEKTQTIFYAEIQRNGVGCWKTTTPFSADNHGTVDQDAQKMIYPSDLTIDENNTLWVMTNSMPVFIYSNLDPNIGNFRIWKQDTTAAVKNTVCQ